MTYFRPILILVLILSSFVSLAQSVHLIGASDEFILENVKGYDSVEEKSLEHEEFNILVFEGKGQELSFYFTFYRGAKICSYIKNIGPSSILKDEIAYIQSNFKRIGDNIWQNSEKTIQAEVSKRSGLDLIMIKSLR